MSRQRVANRVVSIAMFPLLLVLMFVWSVADVVGRVWRSR